MTVKPERLKLPDVPTDSFLGVAPIEVVGPKLRVRCENPAEAR